MDSYYRVYGTHRIVQSKEELEGYRRAHIPVEVVSYSQALESIRQNQAEARKVKAKRERGKAQRRARKRGRR